MPLPSTMTPIATTTLNSQTASITFSSIPSTYTDLVLVGYHKFNTGQNSIWLRFNSATTNYSRTYLSGNGTTAASGRLSNETVQHMSYGNTEWGSSVIHLLNYSNTTTYKTQISRNNTTDYAASYVGLWRDTSAINTILIDADSTSEFVSGTTWTLYGIKAAP